MQPAIATLATSQFQAQSTRMDELLTPYGRLLRRARLAKGWDGETLGQAIGRDKGWVSREESGRPNLPTPEEYRALCAALDIPLRDLLEARGYLDQVELEPGVVYEIREGDVRLPLLRALDAMTPAGMARFVEMFTPVAEKFTASPDLQEGKSRA